MHRQIHITGELNTDYDAIVYGVNGASGVVAEFQVTHEGWVGVTTYTDNLGNTRVKKEVSGCYVWYYN